MTIHLMGAEHQAPACVQCGAEHAENPVHNPMTPWVTRYMCDPCFAKLAPVSDPAKPKRSSGPSPRPVPQRIRAGRPAHPRYHMGPWETMSPRDRYWEDQWHEDHLDDLERDRTATE
jgi:hypothetical protein